MTDLYNIILDLLSKGILKLGPTLVSVIVIALPLLFILYKFFIKKQINLETQLSKISDNLEKLLKLEYLLDFISNNFPVIQNLVNIYTGEVIDIFNIFEDVLKNTEKEFKAIYINGSERYKALDVINRDNAIILESISDKAEMLSNNLSNILVILLNFINELLLELIDKMESIKEVSALSKFSIILSYFDNIKKLILYVKLKRLEMKIKTEVEIKKEIQDYYNIVNTDKGLDQTKKDKEVKVDNAMRTW